MTGPTQALCEFASGVEYQQIPNDVREVGTRMITDTVGVALAAGDSDVEATLRQGFEAPGDRYGVPGGQSVGDIRAAALYTGTLAHALDFDDVHEGMGGHPSAPVLGALLPLADREAASGRELLVALLAGAEVEITLAEAMNPGHYERGWHPTAIVGTIGAAIGAGQLLGLTSEELQRAVGIAASEAAGIKANFGTMTKPLHAGNAARAGIEAADLADAGYTASMDSLERPFGGLCDLFKGDTEPNLEELVSDVGDPWAVVDPRIWFKAYPCCGSVQSAVDAGLELREVTEPDAIQAITVTEHPRRLDHTDTPSPTTGLDAKFSVQYCLAAALIDGEITIDHFRDGAVPRDDIQTLADRVQLDRDTDAFADRAYGASVTLQTDSGTTHTRMVDAPPGSAGNPLTTEQFEKKFRDCARRSLDEQAVDEAWGQLSDLEHVEDMGTLVATIAGG
ncbi:MAG: MmgE/PrpD family protein [Salinirussus sp.]